MYREKTENSPKEYNNSSDSENGQRNTNKRHLKESFPEISTLFTSQTTSTRATQRNKISSNIQIKL